ncbi:MAG: serine/threonine-protein kinase [Aggregatilineales bacterium]
MKLIADRYQILEHLGQGGMGDVFRGVDTRTQDSVAIKNLRGGISNDAQILERFRREGVILQELNHPNIVKMLDMVQQDNENYLIMEFIDGGDLSDMLKKQGKLPFNEAMKLCVELADALSRAHHLGIVHRDIKPANVLIAPDGTPRLTDFGVARIETAERMTGTGMSIGTLDYMPPEAINGEPVDASGDIWGFGVMLYEIITGERPFKGESTLILMSNILTKPVPDIRDFAPDTPETLQGLIEQMLEKEPQVRLRSARQLGATLEALSRGETVNLQRVDTPRVTPIKPSAILIDSANTRPLSAQAQPEATAKRQFPVGVPVLIVLVVIIIGVFVVAASTLRESDTPDSTPSATIAVIAEITPESTPQAQLADSEPAPEGYEWRMLDEISLLIPSGWTELNMDGLITVVRNSLTGEEDMVRLDAGIDFWEQQRSGVSYMNWLNLQGMAVFVEDTGLVLSDETQDERLRGLGELAGFDLLEEVETVDFAGGQARHYLAEMNFNNLTMNLSFYLFQQNASQYIVLFGGRSNATDARQAIADIVLPSVRIASPDQAIQPETTVEPAEPNEVIVPEGWRIINGDGFKLSIPTEWATLPANADIVRSTLELLAPADSVERFLEGISTYDISLLFGTLSPELTVSGALFTYLSTDVSMGFMESYFETLQEILYEDLPTELVSAETLSLPAGTARQTISRIAAQESRPPYLGIVTIIETPEGFYILLMSLPEANYEASASTLNQVVETFTITLQNDD